MARDRPSDEHPEGLLGPLGTGGPGHAFEEFDELLAALGAEPAETSGPARGPLGDAEARLALKDVTITELRNMLAALRPLGELLAESEQRRLELEARLVASSQPPEEGTLRREIRRLEGILTRSRRALERAEVRYLDCRRTSSERWRELRALRAERTRLERELEVRRKRRG